MSDPNPETEKLSIRCPGCGQRFKVGPELEGKMVECGTCDHRFRVEEDVMLRARKFYPGERRDPSLQRFSRVPLQSGPEPEFATMSPPADAEPRQMVEPISPLRVILGFAAVLGAVIVALILMFAGAPGGVLDGAPMSKRLILVGFTSVMAWVLLFFANPTQRIKAVLGGLAISATLFTLPFLFTKGLPGESDQMAGMPPPAALPPGDIVPENPVDTDDPLAGVKDDMGYGKMAEALASYGTEGEKDGRTAIGVWLRDLRLSNKRQVVEYLMRTTDAGERSWAYSRPPGDYLMVLYDVPPNLSRVSKLCERFGEVIRVLDELQVIEVRVDNNVFVQGPVSKLNDPEDPSYYELNRRELESIDLQRAHAAVRRLVSVEPRLFRTDIVDRLQDLLDEADVEMKRDIARALAVWGQEGDGSVAAVREALESLIESREQVPRAVVEYLADNKDEASVAMVHKLWTEDASEWETIYGDFGPVIEDQVLAALPELGALQQLSAARLLGRVGTSKSLPALRKLQEAAGSSEIRLTIEQAIQSIEEGS